MHTVFKAQGCVFIICTSGNISSHISIHPSTVRCEWGLACICSLCIQVTPLSEHEADIKLHNFHWGRFLTNHAHLQMVLLILTPRNCYQLTIEWKYSGQLKYLSLVAWSNVQAVPSLFSHAKFWSVVHVVQCHNEESQN